MHNLKHASNEKMLLHQVRLHKGKMPDSLTNVPELYAGLEFYYTAFLDLTSCRPIGQTEGPIGYLTILQYAQAHKYDDEELNELLYFIPRLDNAYLEHKAEQMKKRMSPKTSVTKNRLTGK